MKKNIIKKNILVFALLLITTACTKENPNEFTIILDWYPNAVHSFIYTAIENGYYEEVGLDVKIQFPSNENDALSLTSVSKADAGIYYMHQTIEARTNQNIPIKSIGAVVTSPLCVFVSLEESNIKSPVDLQGKILGTGESELSNKIVDYVVKENNGDISDITKINVGFELMSAVITKNVDAIYGAFVNHEVPQLKSEGFDVNYFSPVDFGMPNYYELIIVAGEEALEKNPEKYENFIKASQKGYEYVKENPEKAIDSILNYQNEENFPLEREVEIESLKMLLEMTSTEDFLTQQEDVWQETIDWLFLNDMIDKKILVSEVLN